MEGIKPITAQRPHLWLASELMKSLNYKNQQTFSSHVEEAAGMMIMIGIPYYENIIPLKEEGKKGNYNFQLSRFACYLVVMLCDRKKKKVADMQDRFIQNASKYGIEARDLFALDRLKIRAELSEASKWLNSVAAKAKIKDYSSFFDAGYQGMYAMHSRQLNHRRNLPEGASQQEYMGRTELAANLFRITLTEQSIRTRNTKGQVSLEKIHHSVANGIRALMSKHIGKLPEELPVHRDLSLLKRKLKSAYLKMIEAE